jgi:hypothetical protein
MSASCQFFGLPMSQAIPPPMAVAKPASADKSKAKVALVSIIICNLMKSFGLFYYAMVRLIKYLY